MARLRREIQYISSIYSDYDFTLPKHIWALSASFSLQLKAKMAVFYETGDKMFVLISLTCKQFVGEHALTQIKMYLIIVT